MGETFFLKRGIVSGIEITLREAEEHKDNLNAISNILILKICGRLIYCIASCIKYITVKIKRM